MAISLVLGPVSGTSGTSQNFGSSANRVAIAWQENTTAVIAAPTIGGVSMTQVGANTTWNTVNFGSLWRLSITGGLGSGSLAVSFSGTAVGVQVMCLDGCDQTSAVVDATGNADNQPSGTCSVTLNTATANCWLVGGHDNTTGTPVPSGALTTQGSGFAAGMAHSNGTVATGSISGGFTFAGGGVGGLNLVKVAPAATAATTVFVSTLTFMGVG